MLRDSYRKHLSNRRPQSVHKFALDSVFEERLLEIKDERVLDLVQLLAYEVLTLRDLNSLMSERLISISAPNKACSRRVQGCGVKKYHSKNKVMVGRTRG